MYVILKRDVMQHVTPLFYSEGLYKAKKDLKSHCLQSFDKILTFKFTLDEFSNTTVARYSDEAGKSIEVIKIEDIVTSGWFSEEKTRKVTVIETIYLCEVNKYGVVVSNENVSESASASSAPVAKSVPIAIPYDSVVKELDTLFKYKIAASSSVSSTGSVGSPAICGKFRGESPFE